MTGKASQSQAKESNPVRSQPYISAGGHACFVSRPTVLFYGLQNTFGNQATKKFIQSGYAQAKLRAGEPDGLHEQEADRVADAAMKAEDGSRKPEFGKENAVRQRCTGPVPIQRYTIDAGCSSSEVFEAEQTGGMQCQDGSSVPNGTVYNLSFAELPNRCPSDQYSKRSALLIDQAVQRVIETVSSPSRSVHCLHEEEFQQGVLDLLRSTTIRCEPDRTGPPFADMFSNTVYLRHRSINGDDDFHVEILAGKIFHEILHVWEGRFGAFQHSGIVTPCTAACFPNSGQVMVNTNPLDCVMPPLMRGSSFSLRTLIEATRGGGLGLVLSLRDKLFTLLQGHLAGQIGVDISYEHLFSPEAELRSGSDLLQLGVVAGLTYRPGVFDRSGLVFHFDVGPSVEIGMEGAAPGLRMSLDAGLEFDFLQLGAGVGAVMPLSDESEWLLQFMIHASVSF